MGGGKGLADSGAAVGSVAGFVSVGTGGAIGVVGAGLCLGRGLADLAAGAETIVDCGLWSSVV